MLLPAAAEAIRRLNAAGIPVAVVTNQRAIGLGLMSEGDLVDVHDRLGDLLREAGAWIDCIFHCPHEQGTCACRKPGTLLLEQARKQLGLSTLAGSVMIGDSLTDVLAGRAVGARTILLRHGEARPLEADEVADSLHAAVRRMLDRASRAPTSTFFMRGQAPNQPPPAGPQRGRSGPPGGFSCARS
jgi:D-glycero-D-manno-heptose 1,7-bisphosphate phosphatase